MQKFIKHIYKKFISLDWVFGRSNKIKNILEFSLNRGKYIALNWAPKTCQEHSIHNKVFSQKNSGTTTKNRGLFCIVARSTSGIKLNEYHAGCQPQTESWTFFYIMHFLKQNKNLSVFPNVRFWYHFMTTSNYLHSSPFCLIRIWFKSKSIWEDGTTKFSKLSFNH